MTYIVPEYKATSFNCPHCGVLAEQKWSDVSIERDSNTLPFEFDLKRPRISIDDENREIKLMSVSTCNVCHNEHIWFDGVMLLPKVSNVPMPIEEMPEEIKKIYNEARDVFSVSVKAATALLRLALQHLCVELGGNGKNINDDIGDLVKKGLPTEIQQALDTVRVAGNNAVHPGVLNLEDDDTSAVILFEMINIIVEYQIVKPNKISKFYNLLPKNSLNGIRERDSKK